MHFYDTDIDIFPLIIITKYFSTLDLLRNLSRLVKIAYSAKQTKTQSIKFSTVAIAF